MIHAASKMILRLEYSAIGVRVDTIAGWFLEQLLQHPVEGLAERLEGIVARLVLGDAIVSLPVAAGVLVKVLAGVRRTVHVLQHQPRCVVVLRHTYV